MPLWGTLANAALIVVGSLCGLLFRRGIPERIQSILMQVIGLFTLVMGLDMARQSENMLALLISLVLGTVLGEALRLTERLDAFSERLNQRVGPGEGWMKSFVTATLLFCVGSMSIMGALQGGLEDRHDILLTKGVLDGIVSMLFAAGTGLGVMLAAVSVLIYQGAIALAAGALSSLLSSVMIAEMTAVGGVLLLGLGMTMANIAQLRVNSMLPALFMPLLVLPLLSFLGI